MKKAKLLFILLALLPTCLMVAGTNKGNLSNLVVFLRFADDGEGTFDHTFSHYNTLFNDETANANSVYNYFKESSYNQLSWKSVFFPSANEDVIVSYQAKYERAYYQKKTSINPDGYQDDEWGVFKTTREQSLVKELVTYLSTSLPSDMVIDANGDGMIDNLCIVISGGSGLSSKDLLWPHRSALQLTDVPTINGKKVGEYLMLFDYANGYGSMLSPKSINTGVLCHEMSHTLGTYDLYHTSGDLNPVGVWDLMSDNLETPQQMTVYTKYKYCKWIDEIPEISAPGKYVLNPVGGTDKLNIAYKIKPIGSDEYFVVEYRKKEGTFDSGLPSSGLLVYRINPSSLGNVNYNGSTKLDEEYIFRPNGTTTQDGDLSKATFSQESGRVSFGGITTAYKPFYSDGKEANFAIANISSCGETISFDLLPVKDQIYLPQSNVVIEGTANSTISVKVQSDVAWKIRELPQWLSATPSTGDAGSYTVTLTATSANEAVNPRVAQIIFSGASDSSVADTLTISQSSSTIQPPHSLKAKHEGSGVVLSWIAPDEGTAVLSEDFENASNPKGWQIKNANSRGWEWEPTTKYTLSYKGNYSARMREELSDTHQDEWLISPAFSNGKSLSFYSKSTAPGKTNASNFYYVKVSNDGGTTWTNVWDLIKQGTVVNQYERVDVDLSSYMSDNMRVAFNAYDTNQTGLSYWWHVDNVAVYPEVQNSMIHEYHIFRNNVQIGTSLTPTYTDNSPLSGSNVYSVKAAGTFGETPTSEVVTVSITSTGLANEQADKVVTLSLSNDQLLVESGIALKNITVYSVSGVKLMSEKAEGIRYTQNLTALPSGVYVAWICLQGVDQPVRIKFVK